MARRTLCRRPHDRCGCGRVRDARRGRDGADDIGVARLGQGDDNFHLLARNSSTGGLLTAPPFGEVATDSIINGLDIQEFT